MIFSSPSLSVSFLDSSKSCLRFVLSMPSPFKNIILYTSKIASKLRLRQLHNLRRLRFPTESIKVDVAYLLCTLLAIHTEERTTRSK